jgi:hypothetical protein
LVAIVSRFVSCQAIVSKRGVCQGRTWLLL